MLVVAKIIRFLGVIQCIALLSFTGGCTAKTSSHANFFDPPGPNNPALTTNSLSTSGAGGPVIVASNESSVGPEAQVAATPSTTSVIGIMPFGIAVGRVLNDRLTAVELENLPQALDKEIESRINHSTATVGLVQPPQGGDILLFDDLNAPYVQGMPNAADNLRKMPSAKTFTHLLLGVLERRGDKVVLAAFLLDMKSAKTPLTRVGMIEKGGSAYQVEDLRQGVKDLAVTAISALKLPHHVVSQSEVDAAEVRPVEASSIGQMIADKGIYSSELPDILEKKQILLNLVSEILRTGARLSLDNKPFMESAVRDYLENFCDNEGRLSENNETGPTIFDQNLKKVSEFVFGKTLRTEATILNIKKIKYDDVEMKIVSGKIIKENFQGKLFPEGYNYLKKRCKNGIPEIFADYIDNDISIIAFHNDQKYGCGSKPIEAEKMKNKRRTLEGSGLRIALLRDLIILKEKYIPNFVGGSGEPKNVWAGDEDRDGYNYMLYGKYNSNNTYTFTVGIANKNDKGYCVIVE